MLGTLKEDKWGREIVLHGKAKASNREFAVLPDEDEAPKLVADIMNISVDQRVSVSVKVISSGDITNVKNRNGEMADLLELVAGDSSGVCRLILLEKQVSTLLF